MRNKVSWPNASTESLCQRVLGGGTPSTKKAEYYDGDIPWLRTQEVVFNYIQKTDRNITVDGLQNSAATWIPENSVIVAMFGASAGRVAINTIPLTTNQACCNLVIDSNKADYRYVFYALCNCYKALESQSRGAAQNNLNAKIIREFTIPAPPVDVQQKIGDRLSAYDNLIENNQRRIQLLEQSAQLLYKEWFVHLRFPGHERTAITDGVPAGWQLCGMLDHPHFEFIGKNIGSFDGVKRYYATADVTDIEIAGDGIDCNFNDKPSRAQKAPEVNSVWFARMQETYKVLVFTEKNRSIAEGSILSSGFAGFRARRAEFLPWLYLLINNERFHEEKDRYCTGATQRSLTNDGLRRIRVIAPSEQMVGAFSDSVASTIEQILTLQGLNRQLRKARDVLLPRLMSGEVAV